MTRLAFLVGLATILFVNLAVAQPTGDWGGRWDTYWRDGEARMLLQRQGDAVSGTYEPGRGRIEGRIEDKVLRGSWYQDGTSGSIVFALAEDGQSFTGRFVDGEYWNGMRVPEAAGSTEAIVLRDTPRAVFRSLVYLANAAVYEGDISAVNASDGLLLYDGGPTDVRDKRRRRRLLWTVLDVSTFRVYDAPRLIEGDDASFTIGPAAGSFQYTIRFRKIGDSWFVVVPSASDLRRDLDDMAWAQD